MPESQKQSTSKLFGCLFSMKVLVLPGTLRGSIVAPLAPLFEFNTIETPGYRKEMEKYHISKDRYNQGKNKGL